MSQLNLRIRGLPPSATVAINELSDQLRSGGRRIFKMGLGQSPFPVPAPVVEELRRHAFQKAYLPVKGLHELRQAVAQHHCRTFGISATPDDVLVGPGSKELMAGWPREVTLPGLPQIRTCPIQASGSSVYGFATRRSSRRRAPVGPLSSVISLRWVHGSMSVASVPPEVPYTDLRLPSTGSPGVGFPAFRVLCRGSDVSAPRVASLPSLGGSILTPLSSLPARMGVTRPGPGPFL